MVVRSKKHGFSLVEMLTVIAIIGILAVLMLGAGKRIVSQAHEKLAKSAIDVLVSALQVYYDDYAVFPPMVTKQDDLATALSQDVSLTVTIADGGTVKNAYASSEMLFYYLDKNPNSRKLLDALTDTLVSSKDDKGFGRKYSTGADSFDLVRFIDPWGQTLSYRYQTGWNFPLIISNGADKNLLTTQDNITSR